MIYMHLLTWVGFGLIGYVMYQTPCIHYDDLHYFDPRTIQTLICVHEHVSLYWDWVLSMGHHQSINVPNAGAQAFLMDQPQGERAITHHAGPVRVGGC
jgi:hypothetical protein